MPTMTIYSGSGLFRAKVSVFHHRGVRVVIERTNALPYFPQRMVGTAIFEQPFHVVLDAVYDQMRAA